MENRSFTTRHIGIQANEEAALIKPISTKSVESLIKETVPDGIRLKKPLNLPNALSEAEYLEHIQAVADKNTVARSFIGLGYHDCITPPVILRNVLENPGWYTQYTPYQAEISQGRLEMLLNFQTMICDLTGMDIANASLLDEGTAAAEAMTLLFRARSKEKVKGEANRLIVSDQCSPQTLAVLHSRAESMGVVLDVCDVSDRPKFKDDVFGCLFQYPCANGDVRDYAAYCKTLHKADVKIAVIADIMSLVLLKAPGDWGADVVVGSSQRFGVPMGCGGPHAAFFATKDEFKRQMPGRIIGVSVDTTGQTAYRMALQTREQHIRRDKATSNICTAQALLANMAAMYAIYHGPDGLKGIASAIHRRASLLQVGLAELGATVENGTYFDTLTVSVSADEKKAIVKEAAKETINFRVDLNASIGIAIDECKTDADIEAVLACFAKGLGKSAPKLSKLKINKKAIPTSLKRKGDILTHPVFHQYRSETQMMRYLKRLENKDLSLTQSMIPLGSCTMKLNAAAEMMPVSMPAFGKIHPFAPAKQFAGYTQMICDLEDYLSEITGFHATSIQPNSGAQGELAGLLVIKAYLASKGQGDRHVALIPSSAHGTNPASAVMAGMKVVLVKCDEAGNIDVEDLKSKAEANKADLACLMVTYPSTHGVFETSIRNVCKIIHDNGGQVYMDGANMNAQVGLTSPGEIGADVCHLNLHKTFCIPHGGGGPGVGPICVAKHLAPFLPGHPFSKAPKTAIAPVSAAPWGSASILLITYAYIRLMGADGLKAASEMAIVNANYIKARLQDHYPVLFTGEKGHVAHELIIDCRAFKKSAKIEVEDIAKRLIDYGFHAPTMSWPVPGTLMIEPTESEDLAELDRFCEAMIAIRAEIADIEAGKADTSDNVLKHAPHSAAVVTGDNWERPYSREQAAYPVASLRENKFWAPVSRVDNAYGDRNLMCSCPSVAEFAEG